MGVCKTNQCPPEVRIKSQLNVEGLEFHQLKVPVHIENHRGGRPGVISGKDRIEVMETESGSGKSNGDVKVTKNKIPLAVYFSADYSGPSHNPMDISKSPKSPDQRWIETFGSLDATEVTLDGKKYRISHDLVQYRKAQQKTWEKMQAFKVDTAQAAKRLDQIIRNPKSRGNIKSATRQPWYFELFKN